MEKMKVALQLYSIQEDMEKDMNVALEKVKEIGYDYVEFAGYFGHSAKEVKKMLDDNELRCVSVHQSPSLFWEEGQKAIDFVKEIGAEYVAIPSYPANQLAGTPMWQQTVENFSSLGKRLKENGIGLLYHNHDFEFASFEGKYLLDHLFETVPADLLNPEIDTCWVHYAGVDPAAYLRKYAGRIDVVHLKDFVCEKLGAGPVYDLIDKEGKVEPKPDREAVDFSFRPIGYGIQDIPAILAASKESGTKIVVVEQDKSLDRPPMESAAMSRAYLKSLGL